MNDILKRARDIAAHLTDIRRDLHAHPETGTHEDRTAGAIERELREIGLEPNRVYSTGVTALIKGARPGKCVALRADIDALPMNDEKTGEVRSTVPGCMHACGHDAHVACLLGAARILHDISGELTGSVRLIFQPDEEDGGGALPMIKEGIMEDPHVDAAFGLHTEPMYEAGRIGVLKGATHAASNVFDVVIKGVGAHGASPQLGVDPLYIACLCVTALQSVVSRNASPFEPAVVTVGSLHAGSARNIIPDHATLSGTIRTMSPHTREVVVRRVRETIEGICASMGATCEYVAREGYPALINDDAMTDLVREVGCELLGAENVIDDVPTMGGEDFAFFGQKAPSCFFNLGTRCEAKGIVHPHHSPLFDVDESALPVGAAMLAACAKKYLER